MQERLHWTARKQAGWLIVISSVNCNCDKLGSQAGKKKQNVDHSPETLMMGLHALYEETLEGQQFAAMLAALKKTLSYQKHYCNFIILLVCRSNHRLDMFQCFTNDPAMGYCLHANVWCAHAITTNKLSHIFTGTEFGNVREHQPTYACHSNPRVNQHNVKCMIKKSELSKQFVLYLLCCKYMRRAVNTIVWRTLVWNGSKLMNRNILEAINVAVCSTNGWSI